MTDYQETAAATPPTNAGDAFRTLTFGDGSGEHDVADLVLEGSGGRFNRVVCRCGTVLAPHAHTLGYRLGTVSEAGHRDILNQHRREAAGLCPHCGKPTCWCHMTVGS